QTTMYTHGTIQIENETFTYDAKHFDEPSEYGIEGGRISKLGIRKGREVVLNYDRGWVIEPETEGAQLALLAICQKLN
ncbi:MAG: hypothetical protein SPL62_02095, partial [Selenomonas sp.]|nr:hypothetical protein [Selenomonas sp.]